MLTTHAPRPDLRTLDEAVDEEKYVTVDAFAADASLIFFNCKLYNEDGTTYTKCAKALEKWFRERLKVLRIEAGL
jgi:histone acetyltransferase